MRLAPTAAALVEEDGPVGAGIEVAAEACGAPRSGTAVQDDRGLTVGITAGFPVHEVPVSDVEHALLVWRDLGIQASPPNCSGQLRAGA